ncbi:hypothetical protein HJD18_15870 [Thermoleophilia bacterium SCSIO 60948]|nr:hypothetical protein HJD18_15870 [Thermoleophilia bacterium SCSIO 60948]
MHSTSFPIPKSLFALAIAIVATLALLASAAAAQAATFTGETTRDLPVRLETRAIDGVPRAMVISWETGKCQRPGNSFSSRTRFNGFEEATAERLASEGKYVVKQRSENLRSIVRVRVSGKRVSETRWTGRFAAKVRVKKKGKPYERCRQPEIGWSARLSGARAAEPALGPALAEGLRH